MQDNENLHYLQDTLRELLPKANLVPTPLPLVPDIQLYLLKEIWPKEQIDGPVLNAIMEAPPYWTFCWASGQALAYWLLANSEMVRGKTVLDVGSGSGVVAIAAAKAGAQRVIACDIDENARAAISANTALNGVEVELAEDLYACIDQADVLTAADILYDPDNMPLVEVFRQVEKVLLADSRVPNLNPDGYRQIDTISATTWPDLSELNYLNRVRLFLGAE